MGSQRVGHPEPGLLWRAAQQGGLELHGQAWWWCGAGRPVACATPAAPLLLLCMQTNNSRSDPGPPALQQRGRPLLRGGL